MNWTQKQYREKKRRKKQAMKPRPPYYFVVPLDVSKVYPKAQEFTQSAQVLERNKGNVPTLIVPAWVRSVLLSSQHTAMAFVEIGMQVWLKDQPAVSEFTKAMGRAQPYPLVRSAQDSVMDDHAVFGIPLVQDVIWWRQFSGEGLRRRYGHECSTWLCVPRTEEVDGELAHMCKDSTAKLHPRRRLTKRRVASAPSAGTPMIEQHAGYLEAGLFIHVDDKLPTLLAHENLKAFTELHEPAPKRKRGLNL